MHCHKGNFDSTVILQGRSYEKAPYIFGIHPLPLTYLRWNRLANVSDQQSIDQGTIN